MLTLLAIELFPTANNRLHFHERFKSQYIDQNEVIRKVRFLKDGRISNIMKQFNSIK